MSAVLTLVPLMFALTPSMASAQTTRVSVTAANGQATGGGSGGPSMSADGKFVAFISNATNLVPGDEGSADLFVKNRETGAITRVRVGGLPIVLSPEGGGPSISGDGRFIVFDTHQSLLSNDTSHCAPLGYDHLPPFGSCLDVYVHDLQTGETTLASVATGGSQGDRHSRNATISADGRYVLFESWARNLVPDDTNGTVDVFRHDRQTGQTIRVNLATDGQPFPGGAISGSISADGQIVAFLSAASPACAGAPPNITRVFLRDLGTGETVCAPPGFNYPAGTSSGVYTHPPQLSRDGSTIAVLTDEEPTLTGGVGHDYVYTWNRLTGVVTPLLQLRATSFALSGGGRFLAVCGQPQGERRIALHLFDAATNEIRPIPLARDGGAEHECHSPGLTADGRLLVFTSNAANLVADDTNGIWDVFVSGLEADSDNDGMPDSWEALFGLNPSDASDAAADADNDGATNLQEHQAGTHPQGTETRFLAEGAANAFFRTDLHLFNPAAAAASVVVRLLGQNGQVTSRAFPLPAQGMVTLTPLTVPVDSSAFPAPDQAFSIVVESTQVLAVERAMTWGDDDGTARGSHLESAVAGPGTNWYFAEGATHGGFDEFLLLQNANAADVTATVRYFRPTPHPMVRRTYVVPAHSRRTVWIDEEPGLEATDVSMSIEATAPILAERAQYLSTLEGPFVAGHDGAGLPSLATEWFVAEGATGSFFDLYVLVGNPGTTDASLRLTYLLPDGTSFEKPYIAAAESRLTIGVDGEDARLAATAVSIVVRSVNDVPIIVERALWWPSPAWYEGSLSAATTVKGRRWAMASGPIGSAGSAQVATYLLIANPEPIAGNVTLDFFDGDSTTPRCTKTVAIPAQSRTTFGLADECGTSLQGVSQIAGTVTSDGPAIVVERSTYTSSPTRFWTTGSSAGLTLLPEP